MRLLTISALLMVGAPVAAQPLSPIRLTAGVNHIPNAIGPGQGATITLSWRDNGNAWGYDIYSVSVRGSVATIDGRDNVTDTPHTGDDMIKSVRFTRGIFRGNPTVILLTAERKIATSTSDPAPTVIQTYALSRNSEGTGTPYEFVPVRKYRTSVSYCNAEMALKTEIGLPLSRSYSGSHSRTGC